MRRGVIEWAVVAGVLGLLSLPFLGGYAAIILLAGVVLVLLEAAGLLRWLHPRQR